MDGTRPGSSEPLRSTWAGDEEMADLVEIFVSELPDRVNALQDSFEQRRRDDLRRIAHQLKGAGAGYGFQPITDAARDLEDAIAANTDGPLEGLNEQLEELIDVCRRATV